MMRRLRLAVLTTVGALVATTTITYAANGLIETEGAVSTKVAERIIQSMKLPGISAHKGNGRASNSVLRSRTGERGINSGTPGEVRLTCGTSHHAYDDPIVYPRQPGVSHLHTFFGNTLADADSTYESLRGSGDSTCAGGPLKRLSNSTKAAWLAPRKR